MSYRSRGTRTRALAGVVAALLALGLLPLFSGVANAQARDTADACPADAPDAFTDDEGNVHEANINCIAFWEITQGITATQYGPRQFTTRGQMATFIANFIDTAAEGGGTALPTSPDDAFTDDEQSVHENNINRLAEAGVVRGTTATTFHPGNPVTRGQMASFIAQGIDYVNDGQVDGDLPPATTEDAFTDDENSVHENNINRIAAQDIVVGTGGGNFSPDSNVFRDQMASFIAQAADYLAEQGFWPAVATGVAATTRPELVSAAIISTGATGTIVEYCFDEEVTGPTTPVAGNFHVYTRTGDPEAVAATGPTITGNNQCVRVNFAGITTTTAAGNLSVATVDFGAVSDNEGQANSIGDAALGSGQQTTLTAGATDGPDLLTVSGCGPEPTGTGADGDAIAESRCTFTFDERAFTVNPAGFHLIMADDGEQVDCTALAGVEGGMPDDPTVADADTTIVVECVQTATTGTIADAAVARGFVDQDTVSDARADAGDRTTNNNTTDVITVGTTTGNTNPLQASNTPDGATPGPDLVTAVFDANGSNPDLLVYDFDETVQTGTIDPADFCWYGPTGSPQTCGAVSATRGSDDSTVVTTWANGALDQVIGASVLEGAVTDVNGTANQEDEVGVSNTNQTSISAGRTDNPDLTGVAVETVTNVTGTTVRANYTFDEDLSDAEVDNEFFLILPDGTRLVATACETLVIAQGGTEDTDNIVRCTSYETATAGGAPSGIAATNQQVLNAVVGTVDDGAVTSETGGELNPEGASLVSGSQGTPQA